MASAIAYAELLHRAQLIYFVNAKVMALLIVATGWYLIVVTILSLIQTVIEDYFSRGQDHQAKPSLLHNFFSIMFLRRGKAGGAG